MTTSVDAFIAAPAGCDAVDPVGLRREPRSSASIVVAEPAVAVGNDRVGFHLMVSSCTESSV